MKKTKRTPPTRETKTAESDLRRFDSGAVRSPLGLRYDLLSRTAVAHYEQAAYHDYGCGMKIHLEILPASTVAMRLLSGLYDGELAVWQLDRLLWSIGALIHLDRTGKLSLAPSRHAVAAYAEAMSEGSAKYGDENWRKGIPEKNLLQHAVNHLFLYDAGDRSEDHLGHAFWNVATIIHFREGTLGAETSATKTA